ncbi:MAG: heme exporter protein CcmD [Acetobacteraceae bacterium]|nr:heme exporter protein CcmD [Acetobacteraceae bacterium]
MTQHWAHVAVSYALAALAFGGLGLGAWMRHRAARRRLAVLDPRASAARDGSGGDGTA